METSQSTEPSTVASTVEMVEVLSPHGTRRLRAPWKKGQSGNPLGRNVGGLPTAQEMRASLGRAFKQGKLDELMRAWVKHAIKGNPAYLNAILARIWPAVEDSGVQGKVILQGIRLELAPGSTANLNLTPENNSSLPAQGRVAERPGSAPIKLELSPGSTANLNLTGSPPQGAPSPVLDTEPLHALSESEHVEEGSEEPR